VYSKSHERHSADQSIERNRYNQRAAAALGAKKVTNFGPDGALGVPADFRAPYIQFEAAIAKQSRPGLKALDVCCGDGLHSMTAARLGVEVTVCDIAENNLLLAEQRAARAGLAIRSFVANAESIPERAETYDILTCAGSLSYVDLDTFLGEVRRVLRPGGAFVFVDSLNHNPIYRFNRWVRYLRGQRSKSTLERMPTLATLARIRQDFPDLEVSFHGVFSFLIPTLNSMGLSRLGVWLDEKASSLHVLDRFAFKVVGAGHKPSAPN